VNEIFFVVLRRTSSAVLRKWVQVHNLPPPSHLHISSSHHLHFLLLLSSHCPSATVALPRSSAVLMLWLLCCISARNWLHSGSWNLLSRRCSGGQWICVRDKSGNVNLQQPDQYYTQLQACRYICWTGESTFLSWPCQGIIYFNFVVQGTLFIKSFIIFSTVQYLVSWGWGTWFLCPSVLDLRLVESTSDFSTCLSISLLPTL